MSQQYETADKILDNKFRELSRDRMVTSGYREYSADLSSPVGGCIVLRRVKGCGKRPSSLEVWDTARFNQGTPSLQLRVSSDKRIVAALSKPLTMGCMASGIMARLLHWVNDEEEVRTLLNK